MVLVSKLHVFTFVDIFYWFSQSCVLLELTNAQHQLSTHIDTTEHEEREVCAEYRKEDTVIFIT